MPSKSVTPSRGRVVGKSNPSNTRNDNRKKEAHKSAREESPHVVVGKERPHTVALKECPRKFADKERPRTVAAKESVLIAADKLNPSNIRNNNHKKETRKSTRKESPHVAAAKERPLKVTVKESPHKDAAKARPHTVAVKESPHKTVVKKENSIGSDSDYPKLVTQTVHKKKTSVPKVTVKVHHTPTPTKTAGNTGNHHIGKRASVHGETKNVFFE